MASTILDLKVSADYEEGTEDDKADEGIAAKITDSGGQKPRDPNFADQEAEQLDIGSAQEAGNLNPQLATSSGLSGDKKAEPWTSGGTLKTPPDPDGNSAKEYRVTTSSGREQNQPSAVLRDSAFDVGGGEQVQPNDDEAAQAEGVEQALDDGEDLGDEEGNLDDLDDIDIEPGQPTHTCLAVLAG